jgi:hypothetical protein
MKVVTSRAFNQDVSQAKRLAREEPVFVTDRGKPTHVLLSFDAFQQLAGPRDGWLDQIAEDEPVAVEPDWQRIRSGLA